MFANSHCNSVFTVLKAYVAWQFLTFVMTLRPVSLYSYCSLWSFFLSTTWVFDFLLKKNRTCTLSPLTNFHNSLTLGTSPALIVPYSLFTTFFWVLYDTINAQHLNSFWIPLRTYLETSLISLLPVDCCKLHKVIFTRSSVNLNS